MKYGRYQIVKELGKGAMGVVYQAHDPRIDRQIALKVLRQDLTSTDDFIYRFIKEAKAIGRLSHPNIVTVFDVGQDHDTIFIAMELLEGKPLNDFIAENSLSFERIISISIQIAGALDYAHQRGIIHRDIKPTNIIVTQEDHVKITDFGVARLEDSSVNHQTQAGTILGTPSYMSAEQVWGKPVDGRTDLYSLGVILYELCTGTMPFKGSNISSVFMAITQETPIEPIKVNPAIPKPLSDLVMKSLKRNPEKRFQTGNKMKDALSDYLKTMETSKADKTSSREGTNESKGRKPGLKEAAMPIIALAMLCLSAIAIYSYPKIAPTLKKNNIETPKTNKTESVKTTVKSSVAQPPVDTVTIKKKQSALLNITSIPEGAQVFINGALKGTSPLKLELEQGKYVVRLRLPNYYEWEAPIELNEEGEIPPLAIPLTPINSN